MTDCHCGRAGRRTSRWWPEVLLIALGWAIGCGVEPDPTGPAGDDPIVPLPASPFVISNPTQVAAGARSGASVPASAGVAGVAYISLAPGSIPAGTSVSVRNRATGANAAAAIVDGGCDPIALLASPGDTLDLVVALGTGKDPLAFAHVVPEASPPVVVRTEPVRGKRDVPLNAVIIVVFSEPIGGPSLTNASFFLRHGATVVPGIRQFRDVDHLVAEFVPDAPLAPQTEYELVVTDGIEDLDGETLASPVQSGFTTASAAALQLVFTGQPADVVSGAVMAPPVELSVRDALGNPVPGFGDSISIALGQNPGGATLAGTTRLPAVGGVVSFADLRVTEPGVAYTLVASANGVGETTSTPFGVSTAAAPRTGVDLVVTTTGEDLPSEDYFRFYRNGDPCFDLFTCPYLFEGYVPANATVEIDLPGAEYTMSYFTSAQNCGTGRGAGQVTVIEGQVTTVTLQQTCEALGTIVAEVPATGMDLPTCCGMRVNIDPGGRWGGWVSGDGSSATRLPAGDYEVSLMDLPVNCTLSGPSPVSVTLLSGGQSTVSLPIACVENPTLRVAVVTTGPNAPAGYRVGFDWDILWFGSGYSNLLDVPANGVATIRLSVGGHRADLIDVPSNCNVTSPNPLFDISMPLGTVADVSFSVACN